MHESQLVIQFQTVFSFFFSHMNLDNGGRD